MILPETPWDPRGRKVLVLAPHPDDETIGCGGSLALHAGAGDAIKVIFLTDGGKGITRTSQSVQHVAALREREAEAACAILGVHDLEFWGYADQGLDQAEGVLPRLMDLLVAFQPELVYVTSPLEFHTDHRAACFLLYNALRGVDVFFDIALYEISQPLSVNVLVDITPVLALKRDALNAYASQLRERPYDDTCLGLNRFRRLSLPVTVTHAEGFSLWPSNILLQAGLQGLPLDYKQPPTPQNSKTVGPLVSIIVRTKDRPLLLTEALRSITAQTYRNIEVVLVNDGGECVEELARNICRGMPIRYVLHEKSRGRTPAANSGLANAKGVYINFLDDDDIFYPEHVQSLVNALQSNQVHVAYAGTKNVYFEGVASKSSKIREETVYNLPYDPHLLLFENYIPLISVMFSRSVLEKVGGFDESLDLFEDWDFWIRLSRHYPFTHVSAITSEYRILSDTTLEELHREKYDYAHHLAVMFDKAHPFMDGASWLRFLGHGMVGRLKRELQTANGELSRIQSDFASQIQAHNECAAWGHAVQAELSQARSELSQVRSELSQASNELEQAYADTSSLRASYSWKVTAPLRSAKHWTDHAFSATMSIVLVFLRWVYRHLPIGEAKRYRLNEWFFFRFGSFFKGTSFYDAWQGTRVGHRTCNLPEIDMALPGVGHDEVLVFPESTSPEVSVILFVDGSVQDFFLGLKSLLAACNGWQYELIAVGGEQIVETQAVQRRVRGWRVSRNTAPESDKGPWARGIKMARGRYIVFLRFPCRVLTGWLDELTWVLRNNPKAGVASSQILFSDGKLMEAGCELTDSNSFRHIGMSESPLHCLYSSTTEIDFASAISWAMPQEILSGIESEDFWRSSQTDLGAPLAMSIRATGKAVFCAPLSRVVLPWTQSQRKKAEHGSLSIPQNFCVAKMSRNSKGKILFLDTWTPTPDQDSGSMDLISYFQILMKLGYEVSFLPIGDLQFTPGYTEKLQRIGIQCLYFPFVNGVHEHLHSKGTEYALIFLYKVHLADHYLPMVQRFCPDARVVFNTVDLHYIREERQAEVEKNEKLRKQAQQTKQKELSVMQQVDLTILLSSRERDILRDEATVAERPYAVIPIIRDIPGSQADFDERHGVLFIGGFEHQPNVDAALYLVQCIWPLVQKANPRITLSILGSKPTPEILGLANKDVIVTGYLPDITTYFKECRLSVAPLRYGAGLKGKVISSLSYGLPCVATSIAVEGSGLTHNNEVLVADDPESMAVEIIRLHQDRELWEKLSLNGLEYMDQNFSFQAGTKRLQDMLRMLDLPA